MVASGIHHLFRFLVQGHLDQVRELMPDYRLTATATEELRAVLASSSTAEIIERARMILALGECGNARQVAAAVPCDERVVRKWHRRYRAEGLAGLADRKRSGRPRRVSSDEQENIFSLLGKSPNQLSLRQLAKQSGLPTSTVHRLLAERNVSMRRGLGPLWQHIGSLTGGWLEVLGLAASNHEQILLLRHHPHAMTRVPFSSTAQTTQLIAGRSALLGTPPLLFAITDREHAELVDNDQRPFDTACGWIQQRMHGNDLSTNKNDLHVLIWRPSDKSVNDLTQRFPQLKVHACNSRKLWAQIIDPLFMFHLFGAKRQRPMSRCWWRLTEAALKMLPAIQWTPGAPTQRRQFVHFAGDYFAPQATATTDVNDLFESLLDFRAAPVRRKANTHPDQDGFSPLLGPLVT